MTASDPAAIAHANAVRIWGDGLRGELPETPWDEGMEQRLSAVAESYDEETGRSARLLPRKDWR